MIVVYTDGFSFCSEIHDMDNDPDITDYVWVYLSDHPADRIRVLRDQVRVLTDAEAEDPLRQVLP